MPPLDLLLPSNPRLHEVELVARAFSAVARLLPPGGEQMGHSGSMCTRQLFQILSFVDFVSQGQPQRVYDLGSDNGIVLLTCLLVYGWASSGCELTATKVNRGRSSMQQVAKRLCSQDVSPAVDSADMSVDGLAGRAQQLLASPALFPPTDLICVDMEHKHQLKTRLKELDITVLYAFWATWDNKDKLVVMEIFTEQSHIKMLVVSDYGARCASLYDEFEAGLAGSGVRLQAFGEAKMAGCGSTQFRTRAYTRV